MIGTLTASKMQQDTTICIYQIENDPMRALESGLLTARKKIQCNLRKDVYIQII